MNISFTVSQEVLDAIVAHLQAKGFESRLIAGGALIEAKKDTHLQHLDKMFFAGLSKEEALTTVDSMVEHLQGSNAVLPEGTELTPGRTLARDLPIIIERD